MQIFKFGGASVKDADSIKNVARIIQKFNGTPTLVVVSAIGKTTDRLEVITKKYYSNNREEAFSELEKLKGEYQNLLITLFANEAQPIYDDIFNTFVEVEWILEEDAQDPYDYLFDQIVSMGELISSKILASYLQYSGLNVKWLDARDYILTDNHYREANVDWEKTEEKVRLDIPHILDESIIVTQGFIGSTSENFTTTLGREGSDYTAAIFASCLNANSVTIWKDVPGVLNADPKWFDKTELIPELSYTDAIELTYYGATVIHPKTIKPLQNKKISLHVKSFIKPDEAGTVIRTTNQMLPVPSFIFKVNQIQLNIQPRDFSFILEDNLSHIFQLCHQNRIKINMMHNTAIRFSISVDDTGKNVQNFIDELKKRYKVDYLNDLELITIRYYNQETIDRVLIGKEVIQQLKDNYTCQMLVKKKAYE